MYNEYGIADVGISLKVLAYLSTETASIN